MNLLLTFTHNITLERLHRFGLIYREIILYQDLIKRNVDVGFLTYGDHKDREYSDIIKPIKIFPISKLIKSKIPFLRQIKILTLPIKLKKLFSSVDIIKTMQVHGSYIGIVVKILYGKKLIIRAGFEWLKTWAYVANKRTIKAYIYYLLRYTFLFINELIAYKLADGIILTTDHDIKFIVKCFKLKKKYKKNKIQLIYNSVDTELFKPIPLPKKDKHILWIGRFRPGKNIWNILETFKSLKDFQLDLVGNGRYEELMKKRINNSGIKVNFLGIFPNTKIPEIINQYDIFILPSEAEGNPKVLLEAMSCGVACIGSDIKGINNIISHKNNGYLCGLSPESIKNAILTLYNDNQLRRKLGKNARSYVMENCSFDIASEKEYSFYKEILKK